MAGQMAKLVRLSNEAYRKLMEVRNELSLKENRIVSFSKTILAILEKIEEKE